MFNNSKQNENRKKILLVEKDLNTSIFLSALLIENGYEVRLLPVNEKYILFEQSFHPDLVMLNIHILANSLNEFLLYLKEKDMNRKDLAILFLNSFNEIEKIVHDYNLSFTDSISDPIQSDEMLYRIEKLITISQSVDELKQKNLRLEEEVVEQRLNKLIAQEGEERLANILDSVEASIYIKDTDYQYQYANKKLRDQFGKSMDEIVNKDDFQFFDKAKASHLRENDKQVIAFGKRVAEEEINTGLDDLIKTAFLSVKLPLYTDNKIVYALCGISTEITKHKQAETKLKHAINLLEEQHNQLKETQAQLVQAEKMSGLGTLVAGVAHEVNNPTNYIYISSNTLLNDLSAFRNNVTEMISDSGLETIQYFEINFDKLQRSLHNIMEGSERIKTIVQDLKSFSRLDESEKKEINLIETLNSTLRIVKTQMNNEIEIITDYQVDKTIVCYPAQLGQVFLNILINSYHSIIKKQKDSNNMEVGKITVTLDGNSKEIKVTISDNGSGMSEEIKKKIFEPFFTTKPVGQGTGLGLSISYGIIQKHNGRIEVESEIDTGTKMVIVLPLSASIST